MNDKETVSVGPWEIYLGSRLRRTLLIVVGAVLAWSLLQTVWVILWALTHRY